MVESTTSIFIITDIMTVIRRGRGSRLLGGQLLVESGAGRSTQITLRTPLRASVKERNGRLRGTPA